MIIPSRTRELWDDEAFINEVQDIIAEIAPKDEPTVEKLIFIANFFGDEYEKALVAVYHLAVTQALLAHEALSQLEKSPEEGRHEGKAKDKQVERKKRKGEGGKKTEELHQPKDEGALQPRGD